MGLSEVLDELGLIFENIGVEAFATGSRIRDTYRSDSDLDIIVLGDLSTERLDELSNKIDRMSNVGYSIDIEGYNTSSFINRMESGDPRVISMVSDMHDISLNNKTKQKLLNSLPDTPPEGSHQYVSEVKEFNIATACMAIINSIIYNGYLVLIDNNIVPPSPDEVPKKVVEYDQDLADDIQRVLEIRDSLKSKKCEPSEYLMELTELYNR